MNLNYPGKELDLFSNAVNWKSYFSSSLKKYIKGDILEVGAGIGSNTKFLINKNVKSVTCLEPDIDLFKVLQQNDSQQNVLSKKLINGTINDVNNTFDTIIYIDVLEHIEDSKKEITIIKKKLNKNGILIILVPAYNFLYSNFDKEIGHFRRYNKKLLRYEINNELIEKKIFYLDSLGFCASLFNKLFLNKSIPTLSNINFWDKKLIPISKITDKVLYFVFGKSLIGIYQKKYNESM